MIKKLIAGIYAFAITIAAFATADSGDVIILDGEFWNLLARPIWSDSTLYHNLKTVLPEDRSWTTANWDGYTAWWSIRENRLCLDSIMVEFYNKETQQHITRCIDEADMRRVFSDYYQNNEIIATWVTADIRAAKGDLLYYDHSGFNRNLEYEQIFSVHKGKVTDKKSYHNRVVTEGFSFSDLQSQEDIKAKFPLNVGNHPELKGLSGIRIYFKTDSFRFDATGNFIDGYVEVYAKPSGEDKVRTLDGVAQEIKALMKNIHPWKILFINGEYVTGGKGYVMPYYLK